MRFVQTDKLKPGMILGADIRGPKNELMLAAGQVLTLQQITRLMNNDFAGLYITDVYPQKSPEKGIISKKLKDNTVSALSSFLEMVSSRKSESAVRVYDELKYYLNEIIDDISSDTNVMANIVDLKVYDNYTYYHCVNVAALSIMVGAAAGLNRSGLYKLGMGAILHDLGKIFIPKDILNKPGRLTNDEYEQIKKHCQLGGDYLRKNWEIPVESVVGVLTHHERCDGSGYPYGLPLNKQTIEGKLIAICDVYDAMTSERPYRASLSPSEAIEHIIGNSGTMFDPELITIFIKKIAPYPIGSRVVLSNGIKATVVRNYPKGLTRPMVEIDEPLNVGGSFERNILDLFNDVSLLNITIIGLDK